eukprot:TRINITY_DN6637_c0_g1_i1.p1 TRINITY_DN6637_c0_g1~~TRINITY_DN6637_c0_g1_i1.p1  ORF type:complete len:491 (+),score=176.63 TRINITY_DN6637_c0_g1_i1:136-1608(+)
MEEDNTPVPKFGLRKSFMLGPKGSILDEEPLLGVGRVKTNFVLTTIMLCQVPRLSAKLPSAGVPNLEIKSNTSGQPTYYNRLTGDAECIIDEHVRDERKAPVAKAFLRAGPRAKLHFDPVKVNAAVVTCGTLCPGLNSVIHHLRDTLTTIYGAQKVYGVRGGWGGFHNPQTPVIELHDDASDVSGRESLQHRAGSILGCAAGGFDLYKIMDFIKRKEISQLYVIGGDGAQRGAHRIAVECAARNWNVSIAGIPKSVNNDIDIIDRSFGFMTAVEAAQNAIRCATIEAKCNVPNGIGIVKLMGRSTGYLAAYATMASGDVDLCLVPEVPVVLEGKNGCLPHLERVVKKQGYAVVVVSDGAGQSVLSEAAAEARAACQPAPSIGPFLKCEIEAYFKRKCKPVTVKYIDPSVAVRSVAANAFDQILCLQLAQNAVHGAMAGYTAFAAGVVNNRTCMLPMTEITENSPKSLNPRGRTWERVLCITGQPGTHETC